MTGQPLIDDDVMTSSQEGLKKTEYITVGLFNRADSRIPFCGCAFVPLWRSRFHTL
ncbi:hypothetical protein PO124_26250 [Bacillus licheniformis]|nr:hypothetical protein [Bacillus licheniformis]